MSQSLCSLPSHRPNPIQYILQNGFIFSIDWIHELSLLRILLTLQRMPIVVTCCLLANQPKRKSVGHLVKRYCRFILSHAVFQAWKHYTLFSLGLPKSAHCSSKFGDSMNEFKQKQFPIIVSEIIGPFNLHFTPLLGGTFGISSDSKSCSNYSMETA